VIAAFVAPALVLYTVFVAYPLFSALQYSLFDWTGTVRRGFVGADNFVDLFTTFPLDEQLVRAFGHNVVFFLGTMLIQNTLGPAFAVLLHRRRLTRRLFQTLYTLPYMVSPLVVGYLWVLMLRPQFGVLNALFDTIGLESFSLPWLGDPGTALPRPASRSRCSSWRRSSGACPATSRRRPGWTAPASSGSSGG
jgi:raffinose/stachyose/melibiose transport system permease protein